MKKTLLKIVTVFAIIAFAGSCSTDEADINNDTAAQTKDDTTLAARGTFWTGQLGTVSNSGATAFTVDPALIKADFEAILASENNATTLTSITIQLKKNVNNLNDQTYTIIGSDNTGISIGVFLLERNNSLYLDDQNFTGSGEGMSSTTCRGCATGCNLSYVKIDGKKVYYCNENGCGEFCTKNESAN